MARKINLTRMSVLEEFIGAAKANRIRNRQSQFRRQFKSRFNRNQGRLQKEDRRGRNASRIR